MIASRKKLLQALFDLEKARFEIAMLERIIDDYRERERIKRFTAFRPPATYYDPGAPPLVAMNAEETA